MDGAPRSPGDEPVRWISPPPPPPPPPVADPAAPWDPAPPNPLASPSPVPAPPPAWDRPPSPTRSPRPEPPPTRRWIVGLAALATTLLVGVGIGAWAGGRPDDTTSAVTGTTATSVATSVAPTTVAPTTAPPTTQPTPTTTAPPTRLAPPPALPSGPTGPYTFVETESDGEPAAWDPCRPIRFVVSSRLAPPGADGILSEAMTRVSEATGLVFWPEGATDEPASDVRRSQVIPDRYGDDYAPVLVAWTDETEIADFAGATNGTAYPSSITDPSGQVVYVSGAVSIDGDDAAGRLVNGDRDGVVAVVVHELGHLVGLGHVDDPAEVMYGGGVRTAHWGPGDRAGLARVGNGQCVPGLWR